MNIEQNCANIIVIADTILLKVLWVYFVVQDQKSTEYNGNLSAWFTKCKQLFEYQDLPFLRDIWCLYYETFYSRNLSISVIS